MMTATKSRKCLSPTRIYFVNKSQMISFIQYIFFLSVLRLFIIILRVSKTEGEMIKAIAAFAPIEEGARTKSWWSFSVANTVKAAELPYSFCKGHIQINFSNGTSKQVEENLYKKS